MKRPESKAESDDLVDFIALSRDLESGEIEDIVSDIAPGNEAILSILNQVRSAPFIDESFLDYFKKRVWEEIRSL